jgi:multidrug efflux pump subunit AcrA (membrane-fusion protein)
MTMLDIRNPARVAVVLAVIIAAGAWASSCSPSAPAATSGSAGPAAPVATPDGSTPKGSTSKVAPAPAGVLQVPGSVEAYELTDMDAKVSGYIQQVSVDIGDRITAGQLLAVIDVPELQNDLAQAKAEEASRAAAVKFAEAGLAAARVRLDVAKRQLAPYEAVAKLKEETFRRVSALYEGKAANAQDLDDNRSARDAAAADVTVAITKIAAAEADLEVAKTALDLAARQLEVARTQVEKASTLVGYTRIIAPYDGVVTRRLVNRGVLVQAATSTRGAPLLTVQRTDLMRIFADVPEAEASKVRPAAPAEVLPYGLAGQSFRGVVTRTASSLDPATRTLRVEIDLPNPDGRLLHGMYVQVRLQPQAAEATAAAKGGGP